MKKIICLLLALFLLIGCAPEPQWYGLLFIKNCTDHSLHVELNVKSCHSKLTYGSLGTEFDIEPGAFVQIAETKAFLDESMITIERFIDNPEEAFVSVSSNADGIQLSRTWSYIDKDKSCKNLFRLNDCYFERGIDIRKRFTDMNYCFRVYEEDLTEP